MEVGGTRLCSGGSLVTQQTATAKRHVFIGSSVSLEKRRLCSGQILDLSWTSKGTWPLFTPLDLQPLSLAEEPPMDRRSHDRRLEAASDRQVSLCPPGDPRTQTAFFPSGS